ncbi:hypothetical protein LINGRAHAP2_LOCUS24850, partial [Linum grandiflorum]
ERPNSNRTKLRAGEFGNSLGAFRNGVLGEFTREDQTDGGLDLVGVRETPLSTAGALINNGGGDVYLSIESPPIPSPPFHGTCNTPTFVTKIHVNNLSRDGLLTFVLE